MFSTGGEVALDITEGKLFSEGNLEERQRADQETWDRLVHQGVHLLERFAQDNRIRIPQPQQNLQLKVVRELPNANQFVAYVDAIGELDGLCCLMDWKTTTSRYPEEPAGLLSLDPQLLCYSWMTGLSE